MRRWDSKLVRECVLYHTGDVNVKCTKSALSVVLLSQDENESSDISMKIYVNSNCPSLDAS